MALPRCCPKTKHDALTADLNAFIDGTTFVGTQRIAGWPPLMMGNCKVCKGTLAVCIAKVPCPEEPRPDPNGDDERICTGGGR